jgi:two-component system, chemotaxis family, CheB/CheR fusion protein
MKSFGSDIRYIYYLLPALHPKQFQGRISVNMKENPDTSAGSPAEPKRERESFPVVGIGASAGGLEALQELFRAMPPDTGMAFIVITHQHPAHESVLPELLSRETRMTVVKIEDGMRVEPNRVHVLGAGWSVTLEGGRLKLAKLDPARAFVMQIDIFFRSLALDMSERAVSIVLSGTGSDGASGMKEVKAQGGLTLAQEPPSAKYSSMPLSARDTGMVDYLETPGNMPRRIIAYIRAPYVKRAEEESGAEDFPPADVDAILRLLRSRLGHDFSSYKSSTIRRRIQRRMSVHGIADAAGYLKFLHDNRQEAQMLFSELLISVTSFFRDPEAFAALGEKFLPELIKARSESQEFRVWVAGCASGEEAYSIAIILDELRQRLNRSFDIRIFGTDLDDQAIQRARQGVYPASIAADVTPARLQRYFTRDGEDAFQVRKEIRDMLVFAPHNLLSDPPFVRLELLVCRNVLIYLQGDLQKKLLPTFHYSLRPEGLLFLGSSESAGAGEGLFELLDPRWKIFRRREAPVEWPHLPVRSVRSEPPASEPATELRPTRPQTNRLVERMLLERFAPTSIVIDRTGTIVYIHGRTGGYLEPEEQQPRNNVFEMAREGLRLPLSSTVHRCLERGGQAEVRDIRVRSNGGFTAVDLTVDRIMAPEALRGLILITLAPAPAERQPPPPRREKEAPPAPEASGDRAIELERELAYVKESNQTVVEELQSTNEELQSSNEELQSTNEELQSSKEEMESLNEELSTVNNELNAKVLALAQSSDDMQNLLNSTDLAVIFLDDQLRVKRYTARTRDIINLRDTDIGRPLDDLKTQLLDDSLLDECRRVLETLTRYEKEVGTRGGSRQIMRILPYRTSTNVIGGVVATFIDITQLRKAQVKTEELSAVLENMPVGVWITDEQGRILQTNKAANDIWRGNAPLSQSVAEYALYRCFWPDTGAELRPEEQPLARAISEKKPVTGIEYNIRRFDGSEGVLFTSASPILDKQGEVIGAVGISQDITGHKRPRGGR